MRIYRFRKQRLEENLLKFLWRQGGEASEEELKHVESWTLRRLKRHGWIVTHPKVRLTQDGRLKAAHIVRLHRLWEVYLVHIGQGVEKVHRNAEEMEHIITPELEKELEELLGHPKQDPHAQPIPPKEKTL